MTGQIRRKQKKEGFGEFLRERRVRKGISQAEIARLLGISQRTVSHYELEGYIFGPDQLERLAEALGDPPADWLRAAGYLDLDEQFPPLTPIPPAPRPPEYPIRGQIHDSGAISLVAGTPPDWGNAPMDLVVETDTLQPDFRRGDRLTFRPTATARKGQVVVVAQDGQERLVRYAGRTEAGLLVCSANAPDLRHPVELPRAVIVGVLTVLVRAYD